MKKFTEYEDDVIRKHIELYGYKNGTAARLGYIKEERKKNG